MPKLRIAQGDWILVCDGAKALVLENVGDERFPNLQTRNVYQQEEFAVHEAAGAPSRVFKPAAGQRSAVETLDKHDQSEGAFLKNLMDRLDGDAFAGKFKSLVVVAPPRALGLIRQAYTNHVRQAVRGEIDKDLVGLPVHEIEKRLTAHS
jgi:protein required for attachment to host cells